ncbi:GNAT family N-acetyltransferase [Sulfitobacter sp. S190]|uniref:GNAT family N-acetyltransferase n=1 Tax=Sulfitobacter sp. S190 TaxID=2867022 RepID=UPI0021A7C90A|nr:GNAT family N-acetyltransferase [Sulfitobacter sp. S190]UWR23818.1 GNAT family N-acetyltransferase [Sulfitobacter sp. S190]
MTLTLAPPQSPADLDAVRRLCWDYRRHLADVSPIEAELTETFYPVPKYRQLMDTLAQTHARPTGFILLAKLNGAPVGCGMTHALSPDTSEIKRIYVDPVARGQGVAARIVTELMAQARLDGFARAVLDTSKNLHPARALYASLGFAECGPYQDIPAIALPHLVFFEAPL